MTDELPPGWVTTTLGRICSKPQYGWTCKAMRTGSVKIIRTTDISAGKLDWNTIPYCGLVPGDIEKYRVHRNDILVSRAGSVGVSYRIKDVPCDAIFASYLIRFKHLHGIHPQYVEFFLKTDAFWRSMSELSAGIAIPNVNATKLACLHVPLAPLPEQRRIVAKLEELLAKVDACQKRLAKIPILLKRFRQSVLAAACSGRLTADWRNKDPGMKPYPLKNDQCEESAWNDEVLPASWQCTRLGNLTTLITSGSRGWAKYYSSSGSVFIRAQNIKCDVLDLNEIAFVTLPVHAEGLRTHVQRNDLLITITGANLTKSALVEKPIDNAYVSQHVALVRPSDGRISKFLLYAIISPGHGRAQLQTMAYGQGKPGLNLDNIRDVGVCLPPLAEQQEIVSRVDELLALADRIEARYAKAQARVDQLTPSLLAKAFRGELVPQDPTDEPATALLKRIRSERQGEGGRARREGQTIL